MNINGRNDYEPNPGQDEHFFPVGWVLSEKMKNTDVSYLDWVFYEIVISPGSKFGFLPYEMGGAGFEGVDTEMFRHEQQLDFAGTTNCSFTEYEDDYLFIPPSTSFCIEEVAKRLDSNF